MTTAASERLPALVERFLSGFDRPQTDQTRRVGREAEYPLVTRTGDAGDVLALWPLLLEGTQGLEPIEEPGHAGQPPLVVGVTSPTWSATVEVGRGTLELSVGPCDDLHGLARRHLEGLQALTAAADQLGCRLLGYGIQPRTPYGVDLLTPKRRYAAVSAAIGSAWNRFCVTASDQLHVEVGGAEVIALTNLLGALSGPLIALTANSPVMGDRVSGVMSGREQLMARVTDEPGRHGAAVRRYRDARDYVATLASYRCLFLPDGDGFMTPTGSFLDHLDGRPEMDDPAAYEAFLFHEHYIWQSARPRARLGTLEMRPACQQPGPASWIPAALTLGLLERSGDVEAFLEESFGKRTHEVLAAYREQAVQRGMAAAEPSPQFLATLVDLADKGLRGRGRGEEVFLDGVGERLERRRGPGDAAIDAFAEGGARAIVDRFGIDP